MWRPLFPPALVVLLTLPGSAQAPAFTADQLIAKHLEARGGLAKLRAIHSLRITSRVGQAEIPSVSEWKRPGSYRQTVQVQGLEWIQAFDGKAGWGINPFSGYGGFKEPQPLSPEDERAVELSADLDGPLVDWKAKGHKVEYLGEEDVDGGQAYKLKVSLKDGDEITYFLDADTFLSIKEITRRVIRGTDLVSETTLGNYEATGGVYFPRLLQEGEKGSDNKNTLTVDKVEINPTLSDDRFTIPAKKAK